MFLARPRPSDKVISEYTTIHGIQSAYIARFNVRQASENLLGCQEQSFVLKLCIYVSKAG